MPLINISGYGNVVVAPYHPEAPLSEVLEWKTDVINSWNGTETRQRIRKAPRKSLVQQCPVSGSLGAELTNHLYGGVDERYWGIPLWTEAQNLPSVSIGQLELVVDPTYRDFRAGTSVLVWARNDAWEVGTIDTVNASSITLTSGLGASYQNVWIMPMRVGRLGGMPNRVTTGFQNTVKISLEVEDNIDLEPTAPAQYLGSDIYYDEILTSQSGLNETYNAGLEILDFHAGKVDQFVNWTNNRRSRPYKRMLEDMSEVWDFKQFLHRCCGKWRSFWMPSFEDDMRLTSIGPITDTFQFQADEYNDFASNRVNIAIQTRDGSWYPRGVSVSGSGDFLTATLDSVLVDVDASDIVRICYLGLFRLSSDKVTLKWYGGIVNCTVGLTELQP